MHQPPFAKPDLASVRAVETITANFLGRTARITVSDGRAFEGRFVCVDSEVNVILQSAHEYRTTQPTRLTDNGRAAEQKRWAGMVMIPGKHVVNVALKPSASVQQVASTPPVANAFPQDSSLYG